MFGPAPEIFTAAAAAAAAAARDALFRPSMMRGVWACGRSPARDPLTTFCGRHLDPDGSRGACLEGPLRATSLVNEAGR